MTYKPYVWDLFDVTSAELIYSADYIYYTLNYHALNM